jgi:signal transduction histidine kinase
VLTGSELWLLRLMADRGLALLDATTLLIVMEEKGELRVAASSGGTVRLRIAPVQGSALGALYGQGKAVALDRPRGSEAAFLHELGLEARAVLVEPLTLEGHGGGMVIALRSGSGFRGPDKQALAAFAQSVSVRLAAERSVEIERLRYGMEARERERTRWAREIHDESIQGIGALRLQLANARDIDDREALSRTVDDVLEGMGNEIDGLRHLITELRPAALDDLGLAAALEALARRAQAIDGLDVKTQIDFGRDGHDGAGRLDAELESTIYRVVQEALTNVSRHAEANEAVISLTGNSDFVRASVTDDGKGMPDVARLGPREDGGGFGTGGMRERAELVGGELEWAPAPGGGTIVRLTVPLAGRPAGETAEPSFG